MNTRNGTHQPHQGSAATVWLVACLLAFTFAGALWIEAATYSGAYVWPVLCAAAGVVTLLVWAIVWSGERR